MKLAWSLGRRAMRILQPSTPPEVPQEASAPEPAARGNRAGRAAATRLRQQAANLQNRKLPRWRNRAAAARPARLPRAAGSGAEASWGTSGGVLG